MNSEISKVIDMNKRDLEKLSKAELIEITTTTTTKNRA